MSLMNVARRLFVDDDGTHCEITNLIDAEGEETDVADDAVIVVVKRSEHEWLSVSVADYRDCDPN